MVVSLLKGLLKGKGHLLVVLGKKIYKLFESMPLIPLLLTVSNTAVVLQEIELIVMISKWLPLSH